MNILKILTPKRIIGNFGEKTAQKYLKKNGYKILETSYIAFGAEIDIIAKKDNVIAFIEVKTRTVSDFPCIEERPSSAVTPEKQRKIIRAASDYITRNPGEHYNRFDVIEVYTRLDGTRRRLLQVMHLENTFDKNTAYRK